MAKNYAYCVMRMGALKIDLGSASKGTDIEFDRGRSYEHAANRRNAAMDTKAVKPYQAIDPTSGSCGRHALLRAWLQ
ncbi:hypothetical protein BWQ96_06435 [Gracilariopsis chorda]|uniref:Uncharacterized protein n=1 Tax=Gracilariopsis chorda TaxID=448386 RepID=A0A2V3IP21_9FLOR|nr:hypothetical protein BWQ96_06435 [Gracilariopsis chorda]|eukprot:PXF43814.1 hypothetical protein BWQ96_06435 [Gracilariopsis chorda]